MAYFEFTWSAQVEKLLPPVMRNSDFINDNGDFAVGDVENTLIESIVVSHPGHWKEFPTLGVGILKYVNSTKSPQVLARNIRLHLEGDVFQRPYIDVSRWPTVIINNVMIDLNGV